MADVAKLKKQLLKKADVAAEARKELDNAIVPYAEAERDHAVARDRLESAELLETAQELRAAAGKKSS